MREFIVGSWYVRKPPSEILNRDHADWWESKYRSKGWDYYVPLLAKGRNRLEHESGESLSVNPYNWRPAINLQQPLEDFL